MPLLKVMAGCALTPFILSLVVGLALAQGAGEVIPSFGDGKLAIIGEGFRPGERVEITVRIGGSSQQFTARADARGRFRLETGLAIPPLSSVELEARDEQGLTQAVITSAPGALPGAAAGAGPPAAPSPSAGPLAAPSPGVGPIQLPRTGGPATGTTPLLGLAGAISLLCIVGGLAVRAGPSRRGP